MCDTSIIQVYRYSGPFDENPSALLKAFLRPDPYPNLDISCIYGTYSYSVPSLNLTTYHYTIVASYIDFKPGDTLKFYKSSDTFIVYEDGTPLQQEFSSSNGFKFKFNDTRVDGDTSDYAGFEFYAFFDDCPSQYYIVWDEHLPHVTCLPCPTGETSTPDRRGCVGCPDNSYWVNGECIDCGFGKISEPGSTSKDECFNPTSNVFISLIAFMFSILICFLYILRGRFQRVAFVRSYRVNKPLLHDYNRMLGILNRKKQTSAFNEKLRWDISTDFRKQLSFTLFILCSLFAMFICVLVFTFITLGGVAFKSLILVRALKINLDITQMLRDFFYKLAEAIGMSFTFNVMEIFLYILAFFNSFQIDIGEIGVTCSGLQAPGQLHLSFFFFFFFSYICFASLLSRDLKIDNDWLRIPFDLLKQWNCS